MMPTVLHAANGRALTKSITWDGNEIHISPSCFPAAFYATYYAIDTLDELAALLSLLGGIANACIIRGVPKEPEGQPQRRTKEFFPEPKEGLNWVALDVDGIALPDRIKPYTTAALRYGLTRLPSCFKGVSCIARFSAKAGIISPAGDYLDPGLRAHYYFLFDRAVRSERLVELLRDYPVDLALLNPIQIHYTADPIVTDELTQRVKRRVVRLPGKQDCVESTAVPQTLVKRPRHSSRKNKKRPFVSVENLFTCEFMRWFVTEPSRGSGRYHAAWAFASNAAYGGENAKCFVRECLDANRPEGYEHSDTILESLGNYAPTGCKKIYDEAYRCPNFNTKTDTCSLVKGVRSPHSLASHFERVGRNK